jgi:hypothetical protein
MAQYSTHYGAMVEPIINYGFLLHAPIAIISDTWWAELQIAQNNALRLLTGCHAAASLDHLHQECKILPVRKHIDMLAKQFLANAMQPHHPLHAIVTASPTARPNMKPSLQTKYGQSLTPYLRDGVVKHASYKKVLSAIHTADTGAAMDHYAPNKVLGTKPPRVSKQDSTFTRQHRTTQIE